MSKTFNKGDTVYVVIGETVHERKVFAQNSYYVFITDADGTGGYSPNDARHASSLFATEKAAYSSIAYNLIDRLKTVCERIEELGGEAHD